VPSNAINIETKSHSDSDTPTGGSPTHEVIHPMDDDEDEENSRDSDDDRSPEQTLLQSASSPTLPLTFTATQPIAITSNSSNFLDKVV
jgi:hypothetical protein